MFKGLKGQNYDGCQIYYKYTLYTYIPVYSIVSSKHYYYCWYKNT